MFTHIAGPDCGLAQVLIDGQPAAETESDTYAATIQWNHRCVLPANLPPERHIVTLVVTGRKNEESSNTYV